MQAGKSAAGQTPVTSRLGRTPVLAAILVAPLVWTVLYWVLKLPGGTLLTAAVSGNLAAVVTAGGVWLSLLSAVLVYPVLEEFVFRGALQGWLLELSVLNRFKWFISLPNILTSLAFTALHFINHPPLWAALVFLPSLIFGWAREYSGGLTLPILLHIWYNAGFYFLFVGF